jgi:hypothetical protein
VRLLNGESHSGKVAISGTGLSVTESGSTTTFDLANILSANFGESAASETESLPAGAVLTNGSFVAGAPGALDEPAVQLGAPAQPIKVPESSVAAVVFSPIPRATIYRIPNGKTGAVLPNGDFFEGEFRGINNNTVVINSSLFGPQRFVIGTRVSAVVLRDIQTQSARYEITAKNRSRYFTNDLKITGDGLVLNDPIFGTVKVGEGDLVEIHAGGGRYQLLTDLKPEATGEATATDAPQSVSINIGGESVRALTTSANAPVTYAIPSGFTNFICRITMPQETLPAARLIFSVFCDGKLLFRSSPVGPAMNPQNVRVNLGAAQRLTLRVDPAMPGSNTAVGEWVAPMFLRQ